MLCTKHAKKRAHSGAARAHAIEENAVFNKSNAGLGFFFVSTY